MGQWPQQVHCGVGVIVGVGVLCCRRAHSWFQGAAPGTGVGDVSGQKAEDAEAKKQTIKRLPVILFHTGTSRGREGPLEPILAGDHGDVQWRRA